MMGTDSAKADTDGDGVPDAADPCPLTPKGKTDDDTSQIRQAVFAELLATSENCGLVCMLQREGPEGDFARQEYYGFAGYVLPAKRACTGAVNITNIQVKIISPDLAEASISDWEGGLAASLHGAKLKKISGRWVVVEFRMTGIS